jgi:hypothetical protein
MDVWRNMSAYQMSEPDSLWPLLDLLVRFGHGRLITTLTSYCHDPFLVFSRWFRSSEELAIDHLCWAMGRSKSYLYRRKGSLKLDKRYMRINDRFTALLADVPYVQPLNTNLPDLKPIVRDEFSLSIKELDYIFRKSNSLNDVQINCDRNHWPLLFVNALIDQIAVLKDEYGITLFYTDGDNSILKPPRLYSAISSSGVDVLNALSTNIDRKMRFELVEQHLNGEARHGFLNGISASKSFWKQWDDKVKLPAGFQWQSKIQQSIVIRKLELINGDKTNNLVHLIRWQLILEWLASKLNISITT